MTLSVRMILFVTGAIGFALLAIAAGMHMTGDLAVRDRYASAINHTVIPLRNITDAVTAVNFDYRGFDTLGEEFILFVSVMGAVVLLREDKDSEEFLPDAITNARDVRGTDAMHVWILAMVGPKLLLGLYIVAHGQLTPGGGFQGGVVLATAMLVIYLGENFQLFRRLVSRRVVAIVEAIGAGSYAALGLLGMFKGQPFLTNVLPLGKNGEATSGGTIALINLATALEVSCGFLLLMHAFLQETLTKASDHTPSPGTPGEGGGEGDFERQVRTSNSNSPSPQPSPGVPGEGARNRGPA